MIQLGSLSELGPQQLVLNESNKRKTQPESSEALLE